MNSLCNWLAEWARAGRLPAVFSYPFFVRGLLAALLIAPVLGVLSHLVVARRLVFLSTSLGQAALTGLTLGIAFGEPIDGAYFGMLGFCLLCGLAMVYVKRRSALSSDTLVGVFVSFTLGLSICLLVAVTQRFNIHQIEAVMFGSLLTVNDADLLLLLLLLAGVGAVLTVIYNPLLLDSVAAPLARAAGVRSAWLDYVFVMLLTAAIVLSLKVIGALLVESLVVLPAAAARNVTRTLKSQVACSIGIAMGACVGGLVLSMYFLVPSGGAIVLVLAFGFALTFCAGRLLRRGG